MPKVQLSCYWGKHWPQDVVEVSDQDAEYLLSARGATLVESATNSAPVAVAVVEAAPDADEPTDATVEGLPLPEKQRHSLLLAGYNTAADIVAAGVTELTTLEGIGRASAEKILAAAAAAMKGN